MSKNKDTMLRKPFVRSGLIILSTAIIIAILALTFNYLSKLLFYDNPHFRLTNVIVNSSGYWNNRSEDVMKILSLKYGVTNLFSVNLATMRETLNKMSGEGIDHCEINKELPNTLKFTIFERIPVAALYNKKSNMVVDSTGTIIDAKFFKDIVDGLPIITGFRLNSGLANKPYGKLILGLKPALILISLLNTDYPQFNVKIINLSLSNRLVVFMNLPGNKQIKVVLPFYFDDDAPPTDSQLDHETRILKTKLNELKDVLKYVQQRGSSFNEINLLFKDQAVVK